MASNDLEVVITPMSSAAGGEGAVAAAGISGVASSANGNLVNTLHHERLSDIGEAISAAEHQYLGRGAGGRRMAPCACEGGVQEALPQAET